MTAGTMVSTRGPISRAMQVYDRRVLAHHVIYAVGPMGAGAAAWEPIAKGIDRRYELRAMRLPGRESRYNEEPLRSVEDQTVDLAQAIRIFATGDDRPYSIVGMCSGAILAYEVAVELEQSPMRPPARLTIISQIHPVAFAAERISMAAEAVQVSSREWLEDVAQVPADMIDADVVDAFAHVIEADHLAAESYRRPLPSTLACGIVVLRGSRDQGFSVAMAKEWSAYTNAFFRVIDVETARDRLLFSPELPASLARAYSC